MRRLVVAALLVAAACSSEDPTSLPLAGASAWTGDELIVVDGLADAAATWTPDDGWDALPDPELGPIEGARVVATGDGVVLLAETCRRRFEESATTDCTPANVVAARLDVDAGRWRPIAASEDAPFVEGERGRTATLRVAGWDGRLVWAEVEGFPISLDPATEVWRSYGPPPSDVDRDVLCPVDGGVVALDVRRKVDLQTGASRASLLGRDGSWSPVAVADLPDVDHNTGACIDGGAVVVSGKGLAVARFDAASNRWTTLDAVPDAVAPRLASAGVIVVDGAVLVPSRSGWERRAVPGLRSDHEVVAINDAGLIVGRYLRGDADLELLRWS